MAPPTEPFVFPREYHFPPFFTRQTNLTTHHAQLTKWSALVLAYCRHHRIYKLPLSSSVPGSSSAAAAAAEADGGGGVAAPSNPDAGGDTTAAPPAGAEELFHNRRIGRRLAPADVREVFEFMRKDGTAEYLGGREARDVVWVYWRSPEEWATLIEGWVDETAQKGSVLTLYELTEGDGTRGTEIHGMDAELLQKALQVLVKRGKAQIFGQEDSQGVKFF